MASIDDLPAPPKSPNIDDLPPPPEGTQSPRMRAALQGFGKEASFGLLPTAQALAEKGVEALTPESDIDRQLREQGFHTAAPETLAQKRADYVSYNQRMQQAAPGAYTGGQVGGALATAIALGGGLQAGGLLAGAGAFEPLASAVGGGALQGALNAGPKEFQSGLLNLLEREEQAKTGAEYGLGGAAVGAGASKLANAIGEAAPGLKNAANNMAFKALGPYKAQVKQLFNKDATDSLGSRANDVGNFVLENGVVSPGDSIKDIYSKANDLRSQIGKQVGSVYDQAAAQGEVGAFNPKQIGQEFLDKLGTNLKGKAGGQQALSSVQKEVENFMDNPAASNITDIHDYRMGLDDLIYDANRRADSPAASSLKDFRKFLTGKIESHINDIDQSVGGELGKNLKDLNRQYGLASDAASIAKNKFISQEAASAMGLRDTGIGAAVGLGAIAHGGASPGAVGTGIGAALANKYIRTYGLPVGAAGMNAASQALSTAPGQALLKAPGMLVNQVNPGMAGGAAARYGLLNRGQ
jgi:hypothetical protein